jgi:hypothetical protein
VRPPPAPEEALAALGALGIPEVIYSEPFYSNPSDAGGIDGARYEYAGRVVRVNTRCVATLKVRAWHLLVYPGCVAALVGLAPVRYSL